MWKPEADIQFLPQLLHTLPNEAEESLNLELAILARLPGARQIAQRLSALDDALAEDSGSVPSAHTAARNPSAPPVPGALTPLTPVGSRHM